MSLLAILLAATLSLCQTQSTAIAAGPVQDRAGFFSAAAVAQASEEIRKHEDAKRPGRLFVETFPAVPEEKKPELQRLGKEKFFEQWAKDRLAAREARAVLILACKNPPQLEVLASPELAQRAFTQADALRVRDLLVERFKAKEFDAGLEAAVKETLQTFLRNTRPTINARALRMPTLPHLEKAVAQKRAEEAAAREQGSGLSLVLWIVGGLLAVWLLFGLLRAFLRPSQPPGYVLPGQPMPPGGPAVGYPAYGGLPPPPSGGGFMNSMLGGLFGAAAGSYLYDQFFRQHASPSAGSYLPSSPQGPLFDEPAAPPEQRWASAGGSFGDDAPPDAGGDFGAAGGDFGSAGGDFGGGDFGGGNNF